MTRAVIIVDNLGRKSLPPGGVYGNQHVAYKVYIFKDNDVFEKEVLMYAHFKSTFLCGGRLIYYDGIIGLLKDLASSKSHWFVKFPIFSCFMDSVFVIEKHFE